MVKLFCLVFLKTAGILVGVSLAVSVAFKPTEYLEYKFIGGTSMKVNKANDKEFWLYNSDGTLQAHRYEDYSGIIHHDEYDEDGKIVHGVR